MRMSFLLAPPALPGAHAERDTPGVPDLSPTPTALAFLPMPSSLAGRSKEGLLRLEKGAPAACLVLGGTLGLVCRGRLLPPSTRARRRADSGTAPSCRGAPPSGAYTRPRTRGRDHDVRRPARGPGDTSRPPRYRGHSAAIAFSSASPSSPWRHEWTAQMRVVGPLRAPVLTRQRSRTPPTPRAAARPAPRRGGRGRMRPRGMPYTPASSGRGHIAPSIHDRVGLLRRRGARQAPARVAPWRGRRAPHPAARAIVHRRRHSPSGLRAASAAGSSGSMRPWSILLRVTASAGVSLAPTPWGHHGLAAVRRMSTSIKAIPSSLGWASRHAVRLPSQPSSMPCGAGPASGILGAGPSRVLGSGGEDDPRRDGRGVGCQPQAGPRSIRGQEPCQGATPALNGYDTRTEGRALPWERECLSQAKGTVIGLAAQDAALGVASRAQEEGVQLPASHSETDTSMDLSKR